MFAGQINALQKVFNMYACPVQPINGREVVDPD